MIANYDAKVPKFRDSTPHPRNHGESEVSLSDSGLAKEAVVRASGSSDMHLTGSTLSSNVSLKSRLPWLDGNISTRRTSIQTVRPIQEHVNVVPNASETKDNLRDQAVSSLSSPAYVALSPDPKTPRFRRRSILGSSDFKPTLDGGVASGSSPSSSDTSRRPPLKVHPGPLPPVTYSGYKDMRASSRLNKPMKYPSMHQRRPLKVTKIEVPRSKKDTPPANDFFDKQLRVLAESDQKRFVEPAVTQPPSSPEYWPAESSTSDTVSPMTRKPETKRRSFHEPEFNAEMDRLEDLIQKADHLAKEVAETCTPREEPRIEDQAHAAARRISHVSGNDYDQVHHKPLHFRVRNSSSESSFPASSSLSSETVILGSTHQTEPTIQERTKMYKTAQYPEKLTGVDVGANPVISRGRTTHREPMSHVSKGPSRSRSSSSGKHWIGRRPTRKFTEYQNARLDKSAEEKRHENDHVTDNRNPVPPDIVLKQRKKTSESNPPPSPWVPPNHHAAFTTIVGDQDPSVPKPYVKWDQVPDRTRKHRRNHAGIFESRQYRESDENARGERRSSGEHLFRKREPIARRWQPFRKRFTATITCLNTALIGYIVGVYAGMVPRIQYQMADQHHYVPYGNIVLYIGLAISTFICWPLPLLHGRKPYILASLALCVPLQFPQAILVSTYRSPTILGFEVGLLTCRFLTGFFLGFANINLFSTLLDLYGSSLQSERPHQEVLVYNDPRRDGGGLGLWLGIWTWCCIGSISVGFISGAGIIFGLNPAWGFYITVIFMVFILVLNVITPETRRRAHRRSFKDFIGADDVVKTKIALGEIKLHISDEGPTNCFQEMWAGMLLCKRMFCQSGFAVLSLYLGWIYGMNILLIILLGALLSRNYTLSSGYVGLGVFSIAIGAFLAVPLTKGGLFSRARKEGPRTDSMTFERQITWTSHLVRRTLFMILLPTFGIAYTVASPGAGVHFMLPVSFAAVIGFLSNLAISECLGLIMETYDTCDLQPGVNSRHRLQSLAESVKKRRTAYTCYPRVLAGMIVSQTIGFLVAAAATGVGGAITRHLGAQISTGVTAAILMFLTALLTLSLWRFKMIQVIPNHALGTRVNTGDWTEGKGHHHGGEDEFWKPVVIGNPSGKTRRMSLLELGGLSRWTEIRRLNNLI